MKTSEFVKKTKELGFYVREYIDAIHIRRYPRTLFVAYMSKTKEVTFNIDYEAYRNLDTNTKNNLLDLIVAYAKTPIEEREEPTKYYLRLKGTEIPGFSNAVYLNFKRGSGCYFSSNRDNTEIYKTIFTQKEIDKLPRRLVRSFDKVEVEDD